MFAFVSSYFLVLGQSYRPQTTIVFSLFISYAFIFLLLLFFLQSCLKTFITFYFYGGKIYISWNLPFYPFLSIRFSGIKYIHMDVQPLPPPPPEFSWPQTEAPPSNANTPPPHPGHQWSTFCFYEVDSSGTSSKWSHIEIVLWWISDFVFEPIRHE